MSSTLVCTCQHEATHPSDILSAACPAELPYAGQCAYVEQTATVAQLAAVGITEADTLTSFLMAFGAVLGSGLLGYTIGAIKRVFQF